MRSVRAGISWRASFEEWSAPPIDAAPELVNSDPYGDGWMMTIRVGDGADAAGDDGLLDAATYQASLDG